MSHISATFLIQVQIEKKITVDYYFVYLFDRFNVLCLYFDFFDVCECLKSSYFGFWGYFLLSDLCVWIYICVSKYSRG